MTTKLMPWRREHKPSALAKREDFPLFDLHRRMDEMFADFFADFGIGDESLVPRGLTLSRREFPTMPRVDLAETDDEVTVTADLPGLEEKDLDVTLDGDLLTIRGTRKEEKDDKKHNYHMTERYYGEVQRVIQVPAGVDPEKVKAAFKNGVLKVTLTKLPEAKTHSKHIEIKAA